MNQFIQNMLKTRGVLICLLLSACMALPSNERSSELLTVTLLETGSNATIRFDDDVTFRVYTSQDDFTVDYKRMHRATLSPPPPIEINFTDHLVIGLFLGQRPTTGYAIIAKEVRAIAADGTHELEIDVEILRPPPGQLTGQMLTSPYQLISLSRGAWEKIRFLGKNGALLSELLIEF